MSSLTPDQLRSLNKDGIRENIANVLERIISLAADSTRHVLAMLRTIVRPTTVLRSVAATDAKNEFGSVLEAAVQDGAVVITKHDTPKAVLVSVDRVGAVPGVR